MAQRLASDELPARKRIAVLPVAMARETRRDASGLPDDALRFVLAFAGVRSLSAAARTSRRFSNAARARALWRDLAAARWPAVWATLEAPLYMDPRSFYRRLARPEEWRATTPEDVTLLVEIFCEGETAVSMAVPLDELNRESSAETRTRKHDHRLRPTRDARFDALVATVEKDVRDRAPAEARWSRSYGKGPPSEVSFRLAREETGVGPGPDVRATISLVRRRDGACISTELKTYDGGHGLTANGLEFDGVLYPRHARRSFARRRAHFHKENKKPSDAVPPPRKMHYRGRADGESTHEIACALVVTLSGRLANYSEFDYQENPFNPEDYAGTSPDAWEPGDIALRFEAQLPSDFEREDEDGNHLSDGDEDRGLRGWYINNSDGITLDADVLNGLDW